MRLKRFWHIPMMLLAVCGALSCTAVSVSAQSEDLTEAQRLNAQVSQLYRAGRYDEAVSLAERALAIYEKALGPEHPYVATSLNNLAALYYTKGDYRNAEPLYQRALAIYEKALGTEHPDVAPPLNNLAALYKDKGDYGRAEPLYLRALAINEKALGALHPLVAQSLNNLAVLYKLKGDYSRAEPLYLRALAIREKALSPDDPDVAESLNNLAALYVSNGEYGRAEPPYLRALAIYEKALGPEHPSVAQSLNNLAGLYDIKGDYGRAEPMYQRALAVREKALGAEHPLVAESLNSLAEMYRVRADYGRAGLLYQRALAIREKALGAEHPLVAESLNTLALLYHTKGNYERSEPLYQRALAIYEKALGPEHSAVAQSLNNLAGLYYTKGDFGRAEPLYRRALAIREKALGAEHPAVASSLNNLAELYRLKGDYGRSEPLYQRALAIREKALGSEHPDVAESLNNLAVLYDTQGDFDRAEPLYQRVLVITEKALGAEHPDVAASLNNLTALYEAKGDYERAITGLTRAADIREHNIALILNTGSEKQKQLYLDTLSSETNAIVSLNTRGAPKSVAAARLAFTTILRRKGRALDAMTDQIASLRRRAAPEDQKLLDQLTQARSQLANLQLGGTGRNLTSAVRQAQLVVLAEEIEKLEAAISRRSAEFRSQAQPVTLSNVQSALPADAALIEILSYQPFNARAKSDEENFGASRYVVYVARREGDPQFVDLGEAAAIEANVERLRAALRDGKRAAIGDVAVAKEASRAVDEQVMRPVRELLGTTRRLFLSPDGALNLIPFAALVDERGKYLVEDYTLTYLTSGRDLLRLQLTSESKQPPLVLANPLFDDSGNSKPETLAVAEKRGIAFNGTDFSNLSYPPLPGTAEEARALSALMLEARILTGADATEAALKQIHSPRILHVATHGFFLTDQPHQAKDSGRGVGLGASQNAVATAPGGASRNENALLRSGLILAGVNQRRSGAKEDGVLTATEAASLDLWGTKVVVLSACETGLGDVKNGDGVYGLRRALVLAGSESQVMSLWKVSDAATRELMQAYYSRLQRNEGRTEALRQVQLEMIRSNKRKHPFYWASFIQSGAWSGLKRPNGTVNLTQAEAAVAKRPR